jgi:hypothetical protein
MELMALAFIREIYEHTVYGVRKPNTKSSDPLNRKRIR